MGARQVGKSTLARGIAATRRMAYRTLDDADALQQAREDPSGFLADLGDEGALIDEVQRAPGLFLEIKAVVDVDQRKGRYLLSGSAQPEIRSGVGDSLVGRANYRTLRPLITSELRHSTEAGAWSTLFAPEISLLDTLQERRQLNGPLEWRESAAAGGYPRVVAAPPDARREVADSYLATFLARDLPEVLTISAPAEFERFLRLLAGRVGRELNFNGMAQDLGANPGTLRRWFSVLERSYLVEQIPAYFNNPGKRAIKAAKIFFNDAALAMAAAREAEPDGFHLENLLANDLKVWEELAPRRRVYHWRTQSQIEVDFVLEQGRQLVAVEVKSADQVGRSDARHLRAFLGAHACVRGVILSADPDIRALSPNIIATPWWTVV